MFEPHTICRACDWPVLEPVFSLGVQPLANAFKKTADAHEHKFPLEVVLCPSCGLAQLSIVVKPEILYGDYPYVTPQGKTMTDHLNRLAADLHGEIGQVAYGISVLEIGSNEGYFLDMLRAAWGAHTVGVEPSAQLSETCFEKGIATVNAFFNEETVSNLKDFSSPFDLIICRHVFAHIDDWKGFIRALEKVCHKESVVAIEVPYVYDQIRQGSFDQIYHEHLSYVNVKSVEALLHKSRLRLQSVLHYDIHGGSVVMILRHRDSIKESDASVSIYERLESKKDALGEWNKFHRKSLQAIEELRTFVKRRVHEGKRVCGYGASAKATVWINACGFTSKEISSVFDSTLYKQGAFIAGSDIGVYAENTLSWAAPDYIVLFAWNYENEIMAKNVSFSIIGGKWIVPLPELKIVGVGDVGAPEKETT